LEEPNIPDYILRIACPRTRRRRGIVVTARIRRGDIRTIGAQKVADGIGLAAAEVAAGEVRRAGIAVDAPVGIVLVAVDPAAGVDRDVPTTMELEGRLWDGGGRGFGTPAYAMGRIEGRVDWFRAGVNDGKDGEGAEGERQDKEGGGRMHF
jgi:hypothetical protein